MGAPLKVMLVATEASADALGAGLAAALKARLGASGVSFVGVGGGRMAAEGIQSLFSIDDLSMVGLVEIAPAVPRVVRRLMQVVQLGVEQRPEVAVLIDSWFFNYLLALGLRRRAPKMALIKYAAPQVWAMRPGRAKALARSVDHLMTLFGFEARYFEAEGLPTTFVGSPSLSANFAGVDVGAMRAEIGAGQGDPILLILPGSRPSEIKRILPPFEEAAMRLRDARPNLRLVVAAAETVAAQVKSRVAGWRHRAHVVEGDAARKAAMCAASVALTKSGTVTTELAMAGCPIVVGYKANPITAMIGLAIARVKYLTLFNIAAGEAVAPEFIQRDMTPDKLATATAALLDDPARRAAQIAAQNAALAKLGVGAPDPFGAAADVVIQVMRERGWGGA